MLPVVADHQLEQQGEAGKKRKNTTTCYTPIESHRMRLGSEEIKKVGKHTKILKRRKSSLQRE